jgi:hypothetical protein
MAALMSAIVAKETITITDLAAKLQLDEAMLKAFLAKLIDDPRENSRWALVLQYVSHRINDGESAEHLVPYPDNWFWQALYRAPQYDYKRDLSKHAKLAETAKQEFDAWAEAHQSDSPEGVRA